MLFKTNIISIALAAAVVALSGYHFAMGYGLGNHFYVGMSGAFCIVAAIGAHRLLSPSE
jgi:hypothetical protein